MRTDEIRINEDNWEEFGRSNIIEVNLKKGKSVFSLKYDSFNENMNIEDNKAYLKSVKFVLTE